MCDDVSRKRTWVTYMHKHAYAAIVIVRDPIAR